MPDFHKTQFNKAVPGKTVRGEFLAHFSRNSGWLAPKECATPIQSIAPVAAPRPSAGLAALAVDLAGESSVVSLLGGAVASGECSGTGGVPNLPSGATPTDWAGILKNDPGAAGAVIADSFAQGILATV